MLGSRGIPATYSGVETCVENVAVRLASRGHDVTVYCRSHIVSWDKPYYRGVRLVRLPAIRNKYLDTVTHSALCTAHMLLRNRPDVAIYSIAGNSPFAWIARVCRIPTILNVDGLDSQRAKWGPRAQAVLRLAERLSAYAPTRLVTDARVVQRLYQVRFGRASTFIPYGAELPRSTAADVLELYGLQARKYILMVGRLVPENGAHILIAAYALLRTDLPLVIVGDDPYGQAYVRSLHELAGPNVVFTGFIFGDGYRQLLFGAGVFVMASGVGGTHPVLVEAMAAGNCVIVNDHEPNLEVIGDAGLSYDRHAGAPALAQKLQMALNNINMVDEFRRRAIARASALFSWESVTDAYERLCYEIR